MKSIETVIADLECAKFMFCAPELLDRQKLITIEQVINAGIELLKEYKSINSRKGYWLYPIYLDCCCSICGNTPEHEQGESVPLYDYCPYCGAEMEVKW